MGENVPRGTFLDGKGFLENDGVKNGEFLRYNHTKNGSERSWGILDAFTAIFGKMAFWGIRFGADCGVY